MGLSFCESNLAEDKPWRFITYDQQKRETRLYRGFLGTAVYVAISSLFQMGDPLQLNVNQNAREVFSLGLSVLWSICAVLLSLGGSGFIVGL
ncbi:hypothetical protein L204_101284 [Cryptococcus depauperatus]